jgi:hypothetical protein
MPPNTQHLSINKTLVCSTFSRTPQIMTSCVCGCVPRAYWAARQTDSSAGVVDKEKIYIRFKDIEIVVVMQHCTACGAGCSGPQLGGIHQCQAII